LGNLGRAWRSGRDYSG